MARKTIASLEAEIQKLNALLAERNRECQILRTQVSISRAPQRELPLHFQAAREAAMRMGRSVKVSVS